MEWSVLWLIKHIGSLSRKKEHTQTYAHTFTSYAHLSSGGSLSPTDLYFKFLVITIVKQEFMKWNKFLSDKEHHHLCEDAVYKMGEKNLYKFYIWQNVDV